LQAGGGRMPCRGHNFRDVIFLRIEKAGSVISVSGLSTVIERSSTTTDFLLFSTSQTTAASKLTYIFKHQRILSGIQFFIIFGMPIILNMLNVAARKEHIFLTGIDCFFFSFFPG
jgi:hypothetical protein